MFTFQNVTTVEYKSRLADIGIALKAKNCLVFQGQVEAIATMSPKERCAILDEFSGYVTTYTMSVAFNFTSMYNINYSHVANTPQTVAH